MGNRRRDLTLLVIASAAVFAPLAYTAELRQPGLVGGEVITEVVPSGGDCCPMPIPVLPAEFAICHEPGVPAWYVQMEGMALKRDPSGGRTFQTFVERVWERQENPYYVPTSDTDPTPVDPNEPQYVWETTEDIVTPVLGTGDLHFGFQGGGRALIGRTLGRCHALEVSYFEVTDWSEFAFARDDTVFVEDVDRVTGVETTFPASLFSPFSDFGDPPIAGLDYNYLASISYDSSLNSLEFNLRRWILADPCRLQASVLVGGRYMNLDESFFYYTESEVPGPGITTNAVTTDTDNRMLGVQLGAMFEFHIDPGWWIDCEIKGAFFDNDAGQTTTYLQNGALVNQGWRDEHISSYALDLRLTATVLVTPRLAVRGGYQALWLDGMALASDNMSGDIDVLIDGPATLVKNGKVTYHGPHLGISWVW